MTDVVEPGGVWGYRFRGTDPLVEVRVLRLGTNKPARVLVAFVDDSFEGKEEWVPPARLKVPWVGVEAYEAREARWSRVIAVGPAQEDPRSYAASEIIDEYLDEDLATINYRGGDSICLKEPKLLAGQLNLQIEQLTEYPEAFTEDGYVIAPWPATELIARALAEKSAKKVLERVQKEERQARHEAIHGHDFSYARGDIRHISAERSAEHHQEFSAPIRKVLRSWCGAENVDRFDELIALRKEIQRVGDVAQRMISAMRAHGEDTLASQFQRELGTPVDELQVDSPDT